MEEIEKFAVVDIETTGPNIDKGDRIIQIAAIIFTKGKIIARHSMYINPEIPIPSHIKTLTGIQQEDVDKAPTFTQVAKLWYERLHDCVLIAHNLAFDLRVLKESFMLVDQLEYSPKAIDTVKLAKILVPWADGFNLSQLSQFFKLSYHNAHDAVADAEVTVKILTKLAKIIESLDNTTYQALYPFIQHLPHDEIEFYRAPKKYQIEEGQFDYPQSSNSMGKEIVENPSLLSELIIEKMQSHAKIVFEKENPSLSLLEFSQLIGRLSQNEKILAGIESTALLSTLTRDLRTRLDVSQFVIIKQVKFFLHSKAFEYLLENIHISQLNQQELLTIAATIRWLNVTETGDYQEIRKELIILPLLEKYSAEILKNEPNTFYQQMLKRAETAQIVLIHSKQLHSSNPILSKIIPKRLILIDNIQKWYHHQAHNQQLDFSYSQVFTKLQTLYDTMTYAGNSLLNSKVSKLLNDLLDKLVELKKALDQVIKESKFNKESDGNFEIYIQPSALHTNNIFNLLIEVQQLNKEILSINLDYSKKSIKDLSKLLQKISQFNLENEDFYTILKFKQFDSYKHDYHLFSRPLEIKQGLNFEQEESAKGIYLFSQGFYHNKQSNGLYHWLPTKKFHYIHLPNEFSDKIEINVPLSYIEYSDQKGNNAQFNGITQGQEKIILQQTDFIKDFKDELEDSIMIIVPNESAKMLTYQQIKADQEILEEYGVLVQGVHGSLSKVYRRYLEMEKSILIITVTSLLNIQILKSSIKRSIIFQQLPFTNPNQPLLLALENYYPDDGYTNFEDIQLPLMITRFNELLLKLSVQTAEDQLFLFDDRVFTKFYSHDLRETLSSWINFIIKE